MPLSDTGVRNAKPTEKARKIADEKGLYLLVLPSGSKLWRMDYRFQGKRKTLSFGGYPDTGLALARQKRDDARRLLAQDIDPSAEAKAKKDTLEKSANNTFESVATEWMKTKGAGWTDSYASKTRSALERHVFPSLGKKPITEITDPDLLGLLRAIEKRGTVDMAHRIQQHCGAIFRYAIATGKAVADPVPNLRGALATVDQTHYAAITEPLEFAALLRDIDGYRGEAVTKAAMQMMALTFQRTKEIRFAEWSQIDVSAALWRIPAEIMKMREAHVVPLSAQVLKIIEELRPLTGHGRLLFPSAVSKERPISENTITYALARMGYKGRMTGHGFRSAASTILNEQGYRHDVIERQLAHGERNQVRAAYNRAEYLPERKAMMQEWADYLDKLKVGENQVALIDLPNTGAQ